MQRSVSAVHLEILRLYREEGIRSASEIARRLRRSKTTVYNVLRSHNTEQCHNSSDTAKTSKPLDTDARRSRDKRASKKVKIIRVEEHSDSQAHLRLPLYTTGELLAQAAELLLRDIKLHGYSGENVKTWLSLANAYERFKTGEYRIEMILAGIADFAEYVHEQGYRLGVTADNIAALIRILDSFRQEKVQQLRLSQAKREREQQ